MEKPKSNKDVIRTTFSIDHILSNDRTLFNVNNLYGADGRPADYDEVISRGHTRNWVDKFHAGEYHKITIDGKNDLRWMKEAQKIGFHTRKCSGIYVEELEDTLRKYEPLFVPGNWFVRTESVSLKHGCHGVGPYRTLRAILESLVTSTSTHSCFYDNDTEISIYLFPWLAMDSEKEFRIFVYNNEITALSSQHLYSANSWLIGISDADLRKVVNDILDFFADNIRERMEWLGSYVMDLVVLENGVPYFIEPNSFGGNYASGSSLFHWKHDDELLTHPSDTIEVRYAVNDNPTRL